MSWSPQSPAGAWPLLAEFVRDGSHWAQMWGRGRAPSELCPRGFLRGAFIITEFPRAVRTPSDFPKCLPWRLPMHGTGVRSLGREEALEEEMATPSGILAWTIRWTEMPGGLQPKGSQRVGQDWATKHTHTVPSTIHRMPTISHSFLTTCKHGRNQHKLVQQLSPSLKRK